MTVHSRHDGDRYELGGGAYIHGIMQGNPSVNLVIAFFEVLS